MNNTDLHWDYLALYKEMALDSVSREYLSAIVESMSLPTELLGAVGNDGPQGCPGTPGYNHSQPIGQMSIEAIL